MAGSLGLASFLMVLPRLDWTATSPSVFFSATSPLGALPFQFQEAVGVVSAVDGQGNAAKVEECQVKRAH